MTFLEDAKKIISESEFTEDEKKEALATAENINRLEDEAGEERYSLTPEDILSGYLDLKILVPSEKSWIENKLKDNPKGLYRFKALKSLFRAFNLGNIKTFEKGVFILKRNLKEYDVLIEKIKSDSVSKSIFSKRSRLDLHALSRAFQILIEYRGILNEALQYNRGVMTASGIYAFAYLKADQMNTIIYQNISAIDDILQLIISPSSKTISMEELINKFDYPEADLSESDDDWF